MNKIDMFYFYEFVVPFVILLESTISDWFLALFIDEFL